MAQAMAPGWALFTLGALVYAFGVLYLAEGLAQIKQLTGRLDLSETADGGSQSSDAPKETNPTRDTAGRAIFLGWAGFIMGILGLLQGGLLYSGELQAIVVGIS